MSLLNYLFEVATTTSAPGLSVSLAPGLSTSTGPDLSLWSSRPSVKQGEQLETLTRRVGQLNLVIAALVRLCVKQGLVKPAELSDLMRQIDLEDGLADGQLNDRPVAPEWCPKCSAKVPRDKPYCVICGERFDGSNMSREVQPPSNPQTNFPNPTE